MLMRVDANEHGVSYVISDFGHAPGAERFKTPKYVVFGCKDCWLEVSCRTAFEAPIFFRGVVFIDPHVS